MKPELQTISKELTRIREILENNFEDDYLQDNPRAWKLLEIIRDISQPANTNDIINFAEKQGFSLKEITPLLDHLRRRGEIFQPKRNQWQVLE